MPPRSKIKAEIPKELREELNGRLVAGGFSDYEGLTQWLNGRLESEGLEVRISKTALFEHGKAFQEEFEAEMAESRQFYAIAKASLADNQDPEGVVREATLRTMQTRLMRLSTALRKAEAAGDDVHLLIDSSQKLARALAELGKADIASQKWNAIRRQALEEAADRVEAAAQEKGLDESAAKFWREKVLMGM